jgi:hypothetical protein
VVIRLQSPHARGWLDRREGLGRANRRLYRKRRREGMQYVRIPIHVTEVEDPHPDGVLGRGRAYTLSGRVSGQHDGKDALDGRERILMPRPSNQGARRSALKLARGRNRARIELLSSGLPGFARTGTLNLEIWKLRIIFLILLSRIAGISKSKGLLSGRNILLSTKRSEVPS